MSERIEGVLGVESPTDVILKILDEQLIDAELKNNAQERKLLETQKKVAAKKGKSTGESREGASIDGLDADNRGGGDVQPGTAVQTQTSPIPVTKTWFVDNFGMQGSEMVDLFMKSDKSEIVSIIEPLIIQERIALLKSFPSVSPDLVTKIPFTDFDWQMLQKNVSSLEIPFRRFVKSWSDGNDSAYDVWHNRITKEQRLSLPERKILQKAHDVLESHGSMNTQSLQSHGVNGSTTKIAMLIKSHGFLYDIKPQGSGSKNTDKGLFYGLQKMDVFIKDAGALIGGLYEMGGEIEISSRGIPRLVLPFSSNIRKEYANALNNELGVRGIIAEGRGLVIEGEISVAKSIESALPFLHDKKGEIVILKKSLKDDTDALRCLTYSQSKPQKQVSLLKMWNMSLESFETMKRGVIDG
tara:strand:- start:63514 stop:64749 length:1236 start_codon:yes stop_codon:yes gene_type:complete